MRRAGLRDSPRTGKLRYLWQDAHFALLYSRAGADAVALSELHAGRDDARPVQANPC
jgi:hypothetical protein